MEKRNSIKTFRRELRNPQVSLEVKKQRLDIISRPTSTTKKFKRIDSPKHTVKEAALRYTATDRIIEISKPKRYRFIEEEDIVPGSVKPAALVYQASEKDYELSTPRVRDCPYGIDIKKDPFSTSKKAMKYKPTARIIELAKPIERGNYKT